MEDDDANTRVKRHYDINLYDPDDDTKALSCSVKLSKQTRAGVENKEETPQETATNALVAAGQQRQKWDIRRAG